MIDILSPSYLLTLAGNPAASDLPSAHGVAFDSRRVRPGDAFFAFAGAHEHGIRYAEAALEAGAAFIVSDKPHPRGIVVDDPAGLLLKLGKAARATLKAPLIGITGSAGKTSTKALVAAALDASASPGNLNTPFALASILIDAAQGESKTLVLELGIDHVGEMATLVDLVQPTHAVLTLVAASHLLGLGDVATVAREKTRLIDGSPEAFVSSDAAPYLTAEQRAKSSIYGLTGEEADVMGSVVEVTARGQTLEAFGTRTLLPLYGRAMARNAVAALALAVHLGVPAEEAAARLEVAKLEPGRLEVRDMGTFTLIDDSYNSNPASARLALEVLQTFPPPHTAILGDMLELGSESATMHWALGEAYRDVRLITIGSEAAHIAEAHPEAQHYPSFEAAEGVLKGLGLQGTVLVKASRGMRFERIVKLLAGVNA